MNLVVYGVVQFVLYDKHRAIGDLVIHAKLARKDKVDLILLLEERLTKIVRNQVHEAFASLFLAKQPGDCTIRSHMRTISPVLNFDFFLPIHITAPKRVIAFLPYR